MRNNGNGRRELGALLTPKEHQVLLHGLLSTRNSAFALEMAVSTVSNHRNTIMWKLKASTGKPLDQFEDAVELTLEVGSVTAEELTRAYDNYLHKIIS